MGLLGIQGIHAAPNLIHPLTCFFALFYTLLFINLFT